MEILEVEHEKLRDKLVELYQTYDINTIDKKFSSAKKTEEWAENFMIELNQLFNIIEQFTICNICKKMIKYEEQESFPPMMVIPCQHFYCGDCYKYKKVDIGRCNGCRDDEREVI